MAKAGGKVVQLFENTWMGVAGVGQLDSKGHRRINKMGNDNLSVDVDKERVQFDLAVVEAIGTVLPKFSLMSLFDFYNDLKVITGQDDSMVRRGLSSSLGKIAVEDLLLSGALSENSPFFTQTTVGKAIRQKGIETYGVISVVEELDSAGSPVIVDYPEASDPEFDNLQDCHLPNNALSTLSPSLENLVLTSSTETIPSSNLYFNLFYGVALVSGAIALIIAFSVLNVATLGTASGIALAVCGGIGFFGGGFGLATSCFKNSNENNLEIKFI